jgi:hypothetical protein
MTFEDVAGKFRGCSEYANWPKDKTDAIIESVSALERLSDLSKLSACLSAANG